jgi:hypothetical protein
MQQPGLENLSKCGSATVAESLFFVYIFITVMNERNLAPVYVTGSMLVAHDEEKR